MKRKHELALIREAKENLLPNVQFHFQTDTINETKIRFLVYYKKRSELKESETMGVINELPYLD